MMNKHNFREIQDYQGDRNAFGVISKTTGKIYPDLKNYFIKELLFDNTYSTGEFLRRRQTEDSPVTCYRLLMDFKLQKALESLPDGENMKVIVSFQEKFNGRHTAIARIYRRTV